MADINEEQLLSDLLRGIAREDAGIEAPHLEARVTSVFGRPIQSSFGKTRPWYFALAASAVVCVFLPLMFRVKPAATHEAVRPRANATEEIVSQVIVPPPARRTPPRHPAVATTHHTTLPTLSTPSTLSTLSTLPTPSTLPTLSTLPTPTTPTTPATPTIEFVPLMPMTERELAGPFQLVRVQMPRASLGALRSPLDQPNELVEADVLLGEDGMARAIRVSTSGSVYPWRPR